MQINQQIEFGPGIIGTVVQINDDGTWVLEFNARGEVERMTCEGNETEFYCVDEDENMAIFMD